LPQRRAIVPQLFLRLGLGQRQVHIPAFQRGKPLRGIGGHRGHQRLLALQPQPHFLHLCRHALPVGGLAGIGERNLHRGQNLLRQHLRHRRLRDLGGQLHHLGEDVGEGAGRICGGAVIGHCASPVA